MRTISELIKRQYPEIVSCCGNFPEALTFDIGFTNPDIRGCEDGYANDETELTAEGLKELEILYEEFCRESSVRSDTVCCVTLVEG